MRYYLLNQKAARRFQKRCAELFPQKLFEDAEASDKRKILRLALSCVDNAEYKEHENRESENPAENGDPRKSGYDNSDDEQDNSLIGVEAGVFRFLSGEKRDKEQNSEVSKDCHNFVIAYVLFFHLGGIVRRVCEFFFEGGHGLSLFLFYDRRPRCRIAAQTDCSVFVGAVLPKQKRTIYIIYDTRAGVNKKMNKRRKKVSVWQALKNFPVQSALRTGKGNKNLQQHILPAGDGSYIALYFKRGKTEKNLSNVEAETDGKFVRCQCAAAFGKDAHYL